jgi:hypothetical protein
VALVVPCSEKRVADSLELCLVESVVLFCSEKRVTDSWELCLVESVAPRFDKRLTDS